MKREVMKNNKGFSLVELIVVIAIMAVLMAVLAPALLRYVEKSRIQSDDSTAAEVKNALEIALSDDEIYDAIAGSTADVVVTYSNDGSINVTGDTTNNDIETELKTTLKADATTGKIAATKSKEYAGKTYTVTATYVNTAWQVTGEWN
jgi:type IV pilus assembly protein PilA